MPKELSDVHKVIDGAIKDVVAASVKDDPEKVQQLKGCVASVHMVIDQLIERAANRAAESE